MSARALILSARSSKPASRMCILRPLMFSTKRERMPGGRTDSERGARLVIFSSVDAALENSGVGSPLPSPPVGERDWIGLARVLDGLGEELGALVVALRRFPAVGEADEF